eukprot:8437742-Pyramimonas_sp.AAC.1
MHVTFCLLGHVATLCGQRIDVFLLCAWISNLASDFNVWLDPSSGQKFHQLVLEMIFYVFGSAAQQTSYLSSWGAWT